MFIFDFVAETILDQILDWIYGKIIGFLNDFFVMMNNMGVELFDLPWVEAVTTFFGYLGWALFGVGLVVGAFECAIEYQGGRGSIKDTAMNYIKGFMAVICLRLCQLTCTPSAFPCKEHSARRLQESPMQKASD